jgi:hypothetical protein
MKVQSPLISLLALTMFAFAGARALGGQELKNGFCLDCHADQTLSITNSAGQRLSLFVDKAQLAASVHKTNTCVNCHIDATAKHPDDNKVLQPVDCLRCHDQSINREVKAHAAQRTEE